MFLINVLHIKIRIYSYFAWFKSAIVISFLGSLKINDRDEQLIGRSLTFGLIFER
jgi:hypothetical protein